jgi:membrane-associated phospholipid phosphatase
VKLFFALSGALLDAGIACWDAKRFFDSVRPVTAVRFLFAGREVLAWGGPGLGPRRIRGEDWQPYIATPPFGEFPSGHSTFSTAAAAVLTRFTGSDRFGASATIPAGSSRVEPGVTPAADVTLFWPTFTAAADQAGRSRRYGGIHFKDGDLVGRAIGCMVGARAWQMAGALFAGRHRLGRTAA